MIIKVKEGWNFKTDFCGEKLTIGLRAVSGIEELKFGVGEKRNHSAFMGAIVTSITPAIELDFGKKKRAAIPEDLPNIPELSELYFAILVEYGRETKIEAEEVKN